MNQPESNSNARVVSLDKLGRDVWDDYVSKHPKASLYHYSAWAAVFSNAYKLKAQYFAQLDDQGKVVAVLPMLQQKTALFGNHLVSLPFFINYAGLLANDDAAGKRLLAHIENFAKQLGVESITLRDVMPHDISWQLREDKICMHLALPDNKDELWKALGAKRRSQIKRPEREGIEIVHGGVECVDDFYEVIAQNMRDLGSPVHAKKLYVEICNAFPEHAHIVLIKKDNKPVAAGFLIGFKGLLEIPWASSLREYNNIGVNMRLYWEVLQYAIDNHYHTFDFGRSSKDSGTYRFKKQWGAEPVQCYWYSWPNNAGSGAALSNENPKFQLAIKLWQRLPVSVSKILGPMLVKGLP